jgi:alkylation response protein AidB-like acyl-CoA dehydrogenase
MKTPGVTVRPIITIDGSHEVNDVFLENVRVPVENLIGEENKGWTYAKFLLGNERTSMAGIGRSMRYLGKLKKIVKTEIGEEDPAFSSSPETSPALNSMCLRSKRPNCAWSHRWRAESIRVQQPRYSKSGALKSFSASPI